MVRIWFKVDIKVKKYVSKTYKYCINWYICDKFIMMDYIEDTEKLLANNLNCSDFNVSCMELDSVSASELLASQLCVNSFVMIYVTSGCAKLSVNYQVFDLKRNGVASLFDSYLFRLHDVSDDFRCICLFVSKLFMERNAPTLTVAIRTKYAVKMFRRPVMYLKEEESSLLKKRFEDIDRTLNNKSHSYYNIMIVNVLIAVFLDLSHLFELHERDRDRATNMSRCELITKSFIELLTENFREEHKVEFYAQRLNVSNHYLSFLVKKVTGQTPSDFVYEMLYYEARSLLQCTDLSVQDVSSMLCFSDQSSFGKFFKRRAGESPFAYKARNASAGRSSAHVQK